MPETGLNLCWLTALPVLSEIEGSILHIKNNPRHWNHRESIHRHFGIYQYRYGIERVYAMVLQIMYRHIVAFLRPSIKSENKFNDFYQFSQQNEIQESQNSETSSIEADLIYRWLLPTWGKRDVTCSPRDVTHLPRDVTRSPRDVAPTAEWFSVPGLRCTESRTSLEWWGWSRRCESQSGSEGLECTASPAPLVLPGLPES